MIRTTGLIATTVLCLFLTTAPVHSDQPPDVTIKVTRPSDNQIFATEKLYLNGKLVASLRSGDSKTVPLTGVNPGPCTFKVVTIAGLGGESSETRDMIIACRNAFIQVDLTKRLSDESSITGDVVDTSVAKVLSVEFHKELKAVVVKKSPPIQLPSGTTKTVEDTIRVKHSVTLTEGWTASREVKANVQLWWLPIEGGLRYEVQKSTNQSYETEPERKRSVTLTGDGKSASRVLWVEYYRTGKARVTIKGVEVELPFEFREDFDLLTEAAN
jgi:hypothetical protein